MEVPAQNESPAEREFREYKAETTRSRFMHQIFLGFGGATVFGVMGVLTKSLLDVAIATGAAAPIAGLVGIGLLGLGCLYLGAKYLSNTIILDQNYQAKKIGVETRGKTQEIEPAITPSITQPTLYPTGIQGAQFNANEASDTRTLVAANSNIPQTQIQADSIDHALAMPERGAANRTQGGVA